MKTRWLVHGFAALILCVVSPRPSLAQADSRNHWVATWASAQQQGRGVGPARGAAPPAAAGQTPPAAAQPPAPPAVPPTVRIHDQTVRMIVHTSIGGPRVRVQLSNAYGTAPLEIGAARIALRSHDSEIVAGTDRPLLFNGQSTVMIPPGAAMISDAVDLAVPRLSDLAVSVYVPSDVTPLSGHSLALHTTYIGAAGNSTSAPSMTDALTTSQASYWLASVDVMAPAAASTIVAFGDSITDGLTSTANTDRSWPSRLAARLAANRATAQVGVVNEGISGNRVLTDGAGVSALARFDRDVLAIAGARWVMILESINDISLATRTAGRGAPAAATAATPPAAPVTADMLIGAMRQMIERAHTHGIKVIGCTLTPYGNDTDAGEAMRLAVNAFIRDGRAFDAVVDFDAVIRDPNDPRQFRAGFNNTDRLHPNDAGYQAMADAVDLKIFTAK